MSVTVRRCAVPVQSETRQIYGNVLLVFWYVQTAILGRGCAVMRQRDRVAV